MAGPIPGGFGPQSPVKFVLPILPFADALEALDGGDGDSWWSGSQYNFVNVPAAISVAALSLSVAISNTFNFQDEIEAKLIGDSFSQSVVAIGEDSRGFVFQSNEEIFPQATVVLEAGDWIPAGPIASSPIVLVSNHQDEEFLVAVDDTYTWEARWNQSYPNISVSNSNEEIVPQATSFIPEEDYWYQLKSDIVSIQIVNWPGEGIADGSGPQSISIDESDWGVQTPVWQVPLSRTTWYTDEIETTPTGFPQDQDYWFQLKADPVELTIFEWPGIGESGGGSAPNTSVIEESDWQVWTPPLVIARGLYNPDPEELPAGNLFGVQYGGVSFTSINWREIISAKIISWNPTDDLPIPPVPLPFDEEPWQVRTPDLVAKQPIYLPDPEQYPSGLIAPPIIEEEDWKIKWPPLVAASPLYLPDPEQVPGGLIAPPIIDSEPWQVWFPALVAAVPIYLPDPEQIPSGLVPPAPTGRSRYWRERKGIDWSKPFSFVEEIKPVVDSINVQIAEQKKYKEKLAYTNPKADFSSIQKEIVNIEKKIKVLLDQKQEYYTEYKEFAKEYQRLQAKQRAEKRGYISSFPEGLEALELEELINLGAFDD